MNKVFFSLGTSLDGFIAGPNRGPSNPLGDRGVSIHDGLRLFDGVDRRRISVDIVEALHSPTVTHLRHAVRKM